VGPFLGLVQSINSNVVLLENHFLEVRPHIERDKLELEKIITTKNRLLQQLEDKIADGLEKALTGMAPLTYFGCIYASNFHNKLAAVANVKQILKKNQYSSDFAPSARDVKYTSTNVLFLLSTPY